VSEWVLALKTQIGPSTLVDLRFYGPIGEREWGIFEENVALVRRALFETRPAPKTKGEATP
jgi:hypothetical protein